MFKKIKMLFFICIISILTLTGCSSKNSTSSNINSANTTPLSEAEFEQLYSNSGKFEGRRVDFYARIFAEPEKDNKGTYLQTYANDDHNKKTIIGINDPELTIKNGDIIHVTGTVGKIEGEKSYGASLKAPSIVASEIEKSDYSPAFAPAIKTIQVNKEINQNSYVIKLNKIEVAEKETRLFINVENTTKDKIRFYSSKANMTKGTKQIRKINNPNEEIPAVDSDILPGASQKGVLVFEPVKIDGENLKIIFEGDSNNKNLKFAPFTFDVVVK